MDEVLCDFCNKKMVFSFSVDIHFYVVYFCHECYAEKSFYKNILYYSNLYTIINDKMYKWSVASTKKRGHLWLVVEPGVPGISNNKKKKHIISFENNMPSITPSNIQDKLKTIILFI